MTPKLILKEIEKSAGKKKWPIVNPIRGKLLAQLVKHYKPKNILEIGSLVGYSSILMAQNLQKGAKITTLEIDSKIAEIARKNLKKAGAEKSIELIVGDAMKTIPKLDGVFDMVFLDAVKDEYYSYLLIAENKLAPKAVIIADNVKIFEDELKEYLDYVRQSPNYESETFDFNQDAMEVSTRL